MSRATMESGVQIGASPACAALEFKTFSFPLSGTATAELPAAPGAIERDGEGRLRLLHVAPGRYLAPAPTAETTRHLEALAAAGMGMAFDVEGKWSPLTLAGREAARVLAASIDVGTVLTHRECAALRLFDCPAVLAREGGGFALWVEASYAAELEAALARVAAQLAEPHAG